MRCKYCNSERIVKKGFNSKGKQRYLCKTCSRTFVKEAERNYYPHNYKELAIRMFCEGMTMSAIYHKFFSLLDMITHPLDGCYKK